MSDVYIKQETVNKNSKRIWGSFKLSDGTKTKFEMVKGEGWFQWGNFPDNLGITCERVDELCNERTMSF